MTGVQKWKVWGSLAMLIPLLCLAARWEPGSPVKHTAEQEVGDVVDSLHGVYVYYNGSVSNVSGRNLGEGNYNIGLKYQCVEFVKRYYYQHLNHKMPDSYGHAKDFFDPALADGEMSTRRNLVQYTNGGRTKPMVGDLLVFDGNMFNEYGHVAIVSGVTDREIEMIQQNPGPGASSRARYDLIHVDGNWTIDRGDLLGWLRKE